MKTQIIPIDKIVTNSTNPRSEIGDTTDLEASIKAHGIIQPPVVRYDVDNGVYEVIAGSRRLQALRNIGAVEVNCIVNNMEDEEAFAVATAENIIRKNMTPSDECRAIMKMVNDGTDVRSVATHFGHTVRWAIGRIKMAELGEEVLKKVDDGDITLAHAEVLTMCDSDEEVKQRLGQCRFRSPDELKDVILAEKKNLSKAPFNSKKICAKCKKKTECDKDLFGDVTESYCRDGECFNRHVLAEVEAKRAECLKKGYKEYTLDYEWDFLHGYSYIDDSRELNESDAKIVEAIKKNGGKQWFLINESAAEVYLRWKRDEAPKSEDEDEEGDDAPSSDEIRRKANAYEEEVIKKSLEEIFRGVLDDKQNAILLHALGYEYICQRADENGETEEVDESPLLHIGEEDEDGNAPSEILVNELTDRVTNWCGCDNEIRDIAGLPSREEVIAKVSEE